MHFRRSSVPTSERSEVSDTELLADEVVDRNANVAEQYKNGLLTASEMRDCFDRIMTEYCQQWYFTKRKD